MGSLDNMRLSFLPEAVVRPTEAAQVGDILRIASEHRLPVTTRGAGTATTAAASPVQGGWALDLSALDAVSIDAASGMAHAGAGATTYAVNQVAEAQGWFYPPDPSSHKHSTIGGNIATNAGGMRGAKYGVTRDYVLALDAYLASGEALRLGRALRKFAAGYNLRDLLIGSEGTLGVITGCVLKLVPKPETRVALLAAFSTEAAALEVVSHLREKRLIPSVLEFLDRQTTACHYRRMGEKIFPESQDTSPALLIIELDGADMLVRRQLEAALAIAEPLAAHTRTHWDAEGIEAIYNVRRQCSKAMFEMGDSKLNEDIVVPPQAYAPLLEFTLALREEIGLATPTFGHAADGNFHVHIMYNRADADQRQRAADGIQRLMEKVVALGGAISGEHGIGLAKTPFLRLQHNEAEIAAMRAVKQALDPLGILNPGKIFDPVNVWDYEPIKVQLPWDH